MAMTKDPFPFSLTPHRKGQAPKVRLHIRQMRADKSQPTTNENLQSWSCANLKTLAGISFSFSFFFLGARTKSDERNPVLVVGVSGVRMVRQGGKRNLQGVKDKTWRKHRRGLRGNTDNT